MTRIELYKETIKSFLAVNGNIWTEVKESIAKFDGEYHVCFERRLKDKKGRTVMLEVEYQDSTPHKNLKLDSCNLAITPSDYDRELPENFAGTWNAVLEDQILFFTHDFTPGEVLAKTLDGFTTIYIED